MSGRQRIAKFERNPWLKRLIEIQVNCKTFLKHFSQNCKTFLSKLSNNSLEVCTKMSSSINQLGTLEFPFPLQQDMRISTHPTPEGWPPLINRDETSLLLSPNDHVRLRRVIDSELDANSTVDQAVTATRKLFSVGTHPDQRSKFYLSVLPALVNKMANPLEWVLVAKLFVNSESPTWGILIRLTCRECLCTGVDSLLEHLCETYKTPRDAICCFILTRNDVGFFQVLMANCAEDETKTINYILGNNVSYRSVMDKVSLEVMTCIERGYVLELENEIKLIVGLISRGNKEAVFTLLLRHCLVLVQHLKDNENPRGSLEEVVSTTAHIFITYHRWDCMARLLSSLQLAVMSHAMKAIIARVPAHCWLVGSPAVMLTLLSFAGRHQAEGWLPELFSEDRVAHNLYVDRVRLDDEQSQPL